MECTFLLHAKQSNRLLLSGTALPLPDIFCILLTVNGVNGVNGVPRDAAGLLTTDSELVRVLLCEKACSQSSHTGCQS